MRSARDQLAGSGASSCTAEMTQQHVSDDVPVDAQHCLWTSTGSSVSGRQGAAVSLDVRGQQCLWNTEGAACCVPELGDKTCRTRPCPPSPTALLLVLSCLVLS